MKGLRLKVLLVSGMLTIGTIAGIPGRGLAQTTAADLKLQKEKSEIKADVANVKMSRDKIKNLELKYKNERKNDDNYVALAKDKKELRKERANLQLAKAYLKADKRALVDKHNMVISERKKEIRSDKKELASLRKKT